MGSNGMAGHRITSYLKSVGEEVLPVNRELLDVEDYSSLKSFLPKLRENDVVINAIGVLVKPSEENPRRAFYVNSWFPHYLEAELGRTKLIHLSTDCVFSGKRGWYAEKDTKDGVGHYAVTKSYGEVINDKDLTLRMSIIGPELKEGSGLFSWFMRQRGTVKGYRNHLWNGITTLELAKAIHSSYSLTGLYHLVADETISKANLLKMIARIWGKNDVTIKEVNTAERVDRTLIDTRGELRLPGYEEMLLKMSSSKG